MVEKQLQRDVCTKETSDHVLCYAPDSLENPKHVLERTLYSEKVTVWCGVARFGIIGP